MTMARTLAARRFPAYRLDMALHPWLPLHLAIRTMTLTIWDAETWPAVRAELRKALRLRRELERTPWWN
jgi:hypothetical protein